jgi:hypothetical protein
MPRGIAWDELPKWFAENKDEAIAQATKPAEVDMANREVDFQKDALAIGKRVAFGVVCGAVTGASFGAIEALRDTKNLTGNSKLVTQKVLRHTGLFAG